MLAGAREKVVGKGRRSVVGPLYNEPFYSGIDLQGIKCLISADRFKKNKKKYYFFIVVCCL